jgi:sulfite reductase (NADPH) flavoprotein alpha-component
MATEAVETSEKPAHTKNNPFLARLKDHRMLTLEGSAKDTRHFSVDIAGSGLSYECGDSLGIFPRNCPDLVEELIAVLDASGKEEVTGLLSGETVPFRQALLEETHITQPSPKFVKAVVAKTGQDSILAKLVGDRKALNDYLWGREIIDLLLDHQDAEFTPDEFLQLTRKLTPRLYSIASSPKLYPNEVHLTVDTVTYETFGRKRKGVASTYLAFRCDAETQLPVYVQPGHSFRLPEDPATPIIMVGPGTGIAPFRAFLQDRRAIGATGRSWLFFGSQHAKTDFFYQQDLEDFLAKGELSRLDTAFSRDQGFKVYVQHRMEENAEELWKWLDEGAIFYVCGDASRMAKDVDSALHMIIEKAGGKSEDEAKAYVKQMKKDKRYRRDVY